MADVPTEAPPAEGKPQGFFGKLRASFDQHKEVYALGLAAGVLVLTYLIWRQGQNKGTNTLVTGTGTTTGTATGTDQTSTPAPTPIGGGSNLPGSTGSGTVINKGTPLQGVTLPPGSFYPQVSRPGTSGGTPGGTTPVSGAAHFSFPQLFSRIGLPMPPVKVSGVHPLYANVRAAIAPSHPTAMAYQAAPTNNTLRAIGSVHAVKNQDIMPHTLTIFTGRVA